MTALSPQELPVLVNTVIEHTVRVLQSLGWRQSPIVLCHFTVPYEATQIGKKDILGWEKLWRKEIIAGLKLLSLSRLTLEVRPGWRLGARHVIHSLTDKNGSLGLDCADISVQWAVMLNTCSPSLSLGLRSLLGGGDLRDQTLLKALGVEFLPRADTVYTLQGIFHSWRQEHALVSLHW